MRVHFSAPASGSALILNAPNQLSGVAMDLAARCAELLHRLQSGRRRALERAPQDPADMGTAYGLEASLAPVPSEHPDDDPAYNDQDAWLRPR
jgi:hypothetical protein